MTETKTIVFDDYGRLVLRFLALPLLVLVLWPGRDSYNQERLQALRLLPASAIAPVEDNRDPVVEAIAARETDRFMGRIEAGAAAAAILAFLVSSGASALFFSRMLPRPGQSLPRTRRPFFLGLTIAVIGDLCWFWTPIGLMDHLFFWAVGRGIVYWVQFPLTLAMTAYRLRILWQRVDVPPQESTLLLLSFDEAPRLHAFIERCAQQQGVAPPPLVAVLEPEFGRAMESSHDSETGAPIPDGALAVSPTLARLLTVKEWEAHLTPSLHMRVDPPGSALREAEHLFRWLVTVGSDGSDSFALVTPAGIYLHMWFFLLPALTELRRYDLTFSRANEAADGLALRTTEIVSAALLWWHEARRRNTDPRLAFGDAANLSAGFQRQHRGDWLALRRVVTDPHSSAEPATFEPTEPALTLFDDSETLERRLTRLSVRQAMAAHRTPFSWLAWAVRGALPILLLAATCAGLEWRIAQPWKQVPVPEQQFEPFPTEFEWAAISLFDAVLAEPARVLRQVRLTEVALLFAALLLGLWTLICVRIDGLLVTRKPPPVALVRLWTLLAIAYCLMSLGVWLWGLHLGEIWFVGSSTAAIGLQVVFALFVGSALWSFISASRLTPKESSLRVCSGQLIPPALLDPTANQVVLTMGDSIEHLRGPILLNGEYTIGSTLLIPAYLLRVATREKIQGWLTTTPVQELDGITLSWRRNVQLAAQAGIREGLPGAAWLGALARFTSHGVPPPPSDELSLLAAAWQEFKTEHVSRLSRPDQPQPLNLFTLFASRWFQCKSSHQAPAGRDRGGAECVWSGSVMRTWVELNRKRNGGGAYGD